MDYPQDPKVYPGERIPTIPDDSVPENQNQPEFKMPPKEPTTLADEEFKQYFFAESWLELSLDDGMKCFLKWRDQYEGWCSRYGHYGHLIGLEAKY